MAPAKSRRLFYAGLVLALFIGFIAFSVAINLSTKNLSAHRIDFPVALPIIAVLVLWEGVVRGRDLSGLGVKKEHFGRNVLIGVVLAFLGFFTIYAVAGILVPGLMSAIGGRVDTISSWIRLNVPVPYNYAFQTFYAFAFIAPAEELLFRGFIQGKLLRKLNPYLAIAIQSLIFGLVHGVPAFSMGLSAGLSFAYFLIGTWGGVLFGITYYKTGNNIVAPWIAHAISNSPLALLLFGGL